MNTLEEAWLRLRLYSAAIELDAAKKLLEFERAMGAQAEHVLRAQALINDRRRKHVALQTESMNATVRS